MKTFTNLAEMKADSTVSLELYEFLEDELTVIAAENALINSYEQIRVLTGRKISVEQLSKLDSMRAKFLEKSKF